MSTELIVPMGLLGYETDMVQGDDVLYPVVTFD